jgi:hypothetical protein
MFELGGMNFGGGSGPMGSALIMHCKLIPDGLLSGSQSSRFERRSLPETSRRRSPDRDGADPFWGGMATVFRPDRQRLTDLGYPLNEGRLTLQELLRRAKKSSAYLEKKSPVIVALKKDVRAWLAAATGKMVVGAKNIRREVTARVGEASDEVKAIRQMWTEAELEYVDTKSELDLARKELSRLKRENTALQSHVAGRKVSPLHKGR